MHSTRRFPTQSVLNAILHQQRPRGMELTEAFFSIVFQQFTGMFCQIEASYNGQLISCKAGCTVTHLSLRRSYSSPLSSVYRTHAPVDSTSKMLANPIVLCLTGLSDLSSCVLRTGIAVYMTLSKLRAKISAKFIAKFSVTVLSSPP